MALNGCWWVQLVLLMPHHLMECNHKSPPSLIPAKRHSCDDAAKAPITCGVQAKTAYGEVFRGVRGSVQDVAVKRLTSTAEDNLAKFIEVRLALRILACASGSSALF